MIEFMVGLFVVVVLLAGFLQLVDLAKARSEIIGLVRGEAGRRAMSTGASAPIFDDSVAALLNQIVSRSVPEEADWSWIDKRQNRDMAVLMEPGLWSTALGFVRADENDLPLKELGIIPDVPVSPVIRAWVYDKPVIRVGDEVWLPRLGDLY